MTQSANRTRQALTNRERFVCLVRNEPIDRGIFADRGGGFQDWRPTWQRQGMPADCDFGFDFLFGDVLGALGVNMLFHPPFGVEVLKDEGRTQIVRDQYGVIKRVFTGRPGNLQQFLKHPVEDRATWEALKPRLDTSGDLEGRLPTDWAQRCKALNEQTDYPVAFGSSHLCGFFSFLRELMGHRAYYAFYDDPDLVRDMIDLQVHRLMVLLRRVAEDVRIDMQFIFEDICYKNGPLVGPGTFREFLLEPYQRTIEAAKACGVHVFCVDSDGQVDALIPLWIEAGVNVLWPMEVAPGTDVVAVKDTYGDRLVLIGGIDQRALVEGRAAIDREIERIQPAYEMGGYIPCTDGMVGDISWDTFQYYLEKLRQLVGKA